MEIEYIQITFIYIFLLFCIYILIYDHFLIRAPSKTFLCTDDVLYDFSIDISDTNVQSMRIFQAVAAYLSL